MKNLLIILSVIACVNCQRQNDIEAFDKLLGYEKAEAFNSAVSSFQEFLVLNYSNIDNENERISEFLKTIIHSDNIKADFIFNKELCAKVVNDWETSGLRKEIWLYQDEKYTSPIYGEVTIEEEVIPITRNVEIETDTIDLSTYLESNTYGLFLYGLEKYASKDKVILDYVDSKRAMGDIYYKPVAESIYKLKIKYNEPFFMRILIVEFYYDLMSLAIEE
ncbi:hypothetical protein E9993_17905 [Labilibacter sediminis]|nr:hypothetical protein E9993_17905 [Labilibacter sediminis]